MGKNRQRISSIGGIIFLDDSKLKLDEIGTWSEDKLNILGQYAAQYSKILASQGKTSSLKHYYIDAFAGAGVHLSKATQQKIPGSPVNALNVTPPFHGYFFIEMDPKKADSLEEFAKDRKDVKIYRGDCNSILVDRVFPEVRYEQFRRALCFLDPYAVNLKWEVIKLAGQMKSVEIFLNFPIMAMNRNSLRGDKESANPKQKENMTELWGDTSWEQAAYDTESDFFNFPRKTTNEDLVSAFTKRIREIAGFKYVLDPLPIKNNSNSVIYYLIFASNNETGNRIAKYIFDVFVKKMKS